MPRAALVLCLVWLVSLFVLRTAVQWSRTGSTGLKGFHGRPGSLPWLAGLAVSLGFLMAIAGPVAALLGWPGGALLFQRPPLHLLGAALFVAGNAGAFAAQISMGDSWRVGVDEAEKTSLVTTGLFAWVRNPIFSFMGLSLVGLALLIPNVVVGAGVLLTATGIELQVRAVEEPYLAATHGASYRAYAARIGRFVPGLGRIGR
jgi:protein-S-isoprenylcysteine O-methyltransferase Ste14